MIAWIVSAYASAHEGHKPLPTRGMEVNTETGKMVLTKSARETLDVHTAEVGPQSVSQSLLAYGTLVSPWNRHAMVSSTLSGRIVELLVSPGESVKAGQVLAELDSPELESLQLEIRNAQTALNLSLKLQSSTEAAGKSGAIPEIRFIEAKYQVQRDRAAVEIASAKWWQWPEVWINATSLSVAHWVVHYSDRDRQPQWHHDDFALYPPHGTRRRSLWRRDDYSW